MQYLLTPLAAEAFEAVPSVAGVADEDVVAVEALVDEEADEGKTSAGPSTCGTLLGAWSLLPLESLCRKKCYCMHAICRHLVSYSPSSSSWKPLYVSCREPPHCWSQ